MVVTLTGLEDRIQELEKQAVLLPTKDDANLYSQTLMGQWNVLDDFSVEQADLIDDLVTLYTAISSKVNSHITVFDAHQADPDAHHPSTGHASITVDQPIFEAHTGDFHAHHTAVLITGFSPPEVLPAHTGNHDDHPIAHFYTIFNTGYLSMSQANQVLTPENVLYNYPVSAWTLDDTRVVFNESGVYKATVTMIVEKTGDNGLVIHTVNMATGLNTSPGSGPLRWGSVRTEVNAAGSIGSASRTLLMDVASGYYIEISAETVDGGFRGRALPNGISMSLIKVGYSQAAN